MSECQWCDKGDEPKMLDNDGVLCCISGEPGTMCHAYEDCWWPCKKHTITTKDVTKP